MSGFTLQVLGALLLAAPPSGEGLEALTSEHYRFHIEPTAMAEGRALVRNLEKLWSYYQSTLGSLVPLHDRSERVAVYYFIDAEMMHDFLRRNPGMEIDETFTGMPRSLGSGYLAIDGAGVLGRSDLAILFHGAAHLCNSWMLYDQDVPGAWWVREGLAVYFMQTRFDRDDRFRYGEVRSSEGYILDESPRGRAAKSLDLALEPKKELQKVRKAFKKGRHVRLPELLSHATGEPWPDRETQDLASVQAWVLVHFLLHGADGDLRERLSRYLALERRGDGGVDAFRRTVAGDLEDFEWFVFRHAKEMK